MAKEKKESPRVKVLVKKAIAYGGRDLRPVQDGTRITPIRAEIPLDVALAHAPRNVEILDEEYKGLTKTPVTKPAVATVTK